MDRSIYTCGTRAGSDLDGFMKCYGNGRGAHSWDFELRVDTTIQRMLHTQGI